MVYKEAVGFYSSVSLQEQPIALAKDQDYVVFYEHVDVVMLKTDL